MVLHKSSWVTVRGEKSCLYSVTMTQNNEAHMKGLRGFSFYFLFYLSLFFFLGVKQKPPDFTKLYYSWYPNLVVGETDTCDDFLKRNKLPQLYMYNVMYYFGISMGSMICTQLYPCSHNYEKSETTILIKQFLDGRYLPSNFITCLASWQSREKEKLWKRKTKRRNSVPKWINAERWKI